MKLKVGHLYKVRKYLSGFNSENRNDKNIKIYCLEKGEIICILKSPEEIFEVNGYSYFRTQLLNNNNQILYLFQPRSEIDSLQELFIHLK